MYTQVREEIPMAEKSTKAQPTTPADAAAAWRVLGIYVGVLLLACGGYWLWGASRNLPFRHRPAGRALPLRKQFTASA